MTFATFVAEKKIADNIRLKAVNGRFQTGETSPKTVLQGLRCRTFYMFHFRLPSFYSLNRLPNGRIATALARLMLKTAFRAEIAAPNSTRRIHADIAGWALNAA